MELIEPKLGYFFYTLVGVASAVGLAIGIAVYLMLRNKGKRSQKATKQ